MKKAVKMTIPEIRYKLHQLAEEHDMPILHFLAEQTKRIYVKPVAPRESKAVTSAKKNSVLVYYRKHTRASILKMANMFGIGTGRISEIIGGKR